MRYAVLHHTAAAQVVWVGHTEPAVLRFMHSADGCGWEAQKKIEFKIVAKFKIVDRSSGCVRLRRTDGRRCTLRY